MGSSRTADPGEGLSRRSFLTGACVGAAGLVACRSGSGTRGSADREADGPSASYSYGDHSRQVADLYLPGTGDGPWPVVVLLHGGFWRSDYDRSLMVPVATDLVTGGYAAWNVGYRTTADDGGGWPSTFEDVAAAIDRLGGVAGDHGLDLERVITVGHSAGGTFSLWAAARPHFGAFAPGHDPKVRVCGAVALAGISNLVSGWFERLGDGAVDALMGTGPHQDREIYRMASPEDLLPIGIPQLLVHGSDDPIVAVAQSTAYAGKASEAGDDAELVVLDGVGHFDALEPSSKAWEEVTSRLAKLCGDR